jgi:hypothetical protein
MLSENIYFYFYIYIYIYINHPIFEMYEHI